VAVRGFTTSSYILYGYSTSGQELECVCVCVYICSICIYMQYTFLYSIFICLCCNKHVRDPHRTFLVQSILTGCGILDTQTLPLHTKPFL